MHFCRLDRKLGLALLCIVTFAILLAAGKAIVSHSPAAMLAAEVERHALLASDSASHGHIHGDHAHENGEDDEQQAGHLHGHNPADHSHDMPIQLGLYRLTGTEIVGIWQSSNPAALAGRRSARLERPPDLLT